MIPSPARLGTSFWLQAVGLSSFRAASLKVALPVVLGPPFLPAVVGVALRRRRPPGERAEPRVGVHIEDVQALRVRRPSILAEAWLLDRMPVGDVPQDRRL